MSLYAISGADSDTFETVFWKGVTERIDDVPMRGSMGVSWQLYRDMNALRSKRPLQDEIMALRRNKQDPRHPEKGVPYDAQTARFLATFYAFAEQTLQPFFFIKRGKTALWLVRKTGGYQYVDDPADPTWNPHRVTFEFVRAATEEEARSDNKGPQTICRILPSLELPKPDEPIVPQMPPKHIVVAKSKVPSKKAQTQAQAKAITTKPATAPKAATPFAITSTYMEAKDLPIPVEETEVIKVVPFEHKGIKYFRDPVSQMLYKHLTMGSTSYPGLSVGHWNEQKNTIDLAENASPSI